jgi:hypothetical protein
MLLKWQYDSNSSDLRIAILQVEHGRLCEYVLSRADLQSQN